MKKKIVVLLELFFFIINVFSQTAVFDPTVNLSVITDWLATIDQLYQMYDHTMNQIKMIEQNYERLQFYIEQAQQFDFEDIEWDGDLDFRNEIRDATRQVNRQLNNIRGVRDTLNAKTITFGNQSFSFASLCGVSSKYGNAVDMVRAANNYYDDGFRQAAEYWAEGVPEADAQRLWARYGLNPANYKMVRDVEDKLNEKIEFLIGSAEEDIKQMNEEDQTLYQTINNIMDMLGKQDVTEKELMQAQGMLQQQTIMTLKQMQTDLQQGMSYLVWKDRYDRQLAEAKKQSEMERLQEMESNSIPDYF